MDKYDSIFKNKVQPHFTLKRKNCIFTSLIFTNTFISGDSRYSFLLIDSFNLYKSLPNRLQRPYKYANLIYFSVCCALGKIPSRQKYNQMAVVQNSLFKKRTSSENQTLTN